MATDFAALTQELAAADRQVLDARDELHRLKHRLDVVSTRLEIAAEVLTTLLARAKMETYIERVRAEELADARITDNRGPDAA